VTSKVERVERILDEVVKLRVGSAH
jgi:hypothetical protein